MPVKDPLREELMKAMAVIYGSEEDVASRIGKIEDMIEQVTADCGLGIRYLVFIDLAAEAKEDLEAARAAHGSI